MNTKHLSHTCIAGLIMGGFAPFAFTQPEQIQKKQSVEQQIQQQQREQTQAPEQISPDSSAEQQENESDPAIRAELGKVAPTAANSATAKTIPGNRGTR